jgi:hypothetical protein
VITTRSGVVVLTMGLFVVAAQATPGHAQRSEEGVSPARATALRECNRIAKNMYPQYDNDHNFNEALKACMAAHGQME